MVLRVIHASRIECIDLRLVTANHGLVVETSDHFLLTTTATCYELSQSLKQFCFDGPRPFHSYGPDS
jgi:hypothetical protein